MSVISENWIERKRPLRLERRIEFSDYDQTRDFLDRSAEISEAENCYPDLSFSRTHVSIALHLEDGETELGEKLIRFAQLIDDIVPASLNDADEELR
ncbi:MAG: pterin-4-alpha-carbinolamine dehydratase [Gammaproteobacteria bacterium]|nr:pterin-4-alpha-carbinolamine dehydratase [Gammaproteobacteria bacterium]